MTTVLRIGTRGSPLALAQAVLTREALSNICRLSGASMQTVVVSTEGDRVQDRPLAEIGGKALWTRELDAALLDGRIDIGVHSMKDVETRLAEGVVLAAFLPRADPSDRLVGASSIAAIPHGATIGTSSPRRAAQLLARRPDLKIVSLRGNVGTRLRKVDEGEVAATFLASAGLDRLGIAAGVELALADWLPAASQGAVGITARASDTELLEKLALLDHGPTRAAVEAERGLLEGLGGSCHTAVAAHASFGPGLQLSAELLSPDGKERVLGHIRSSGERPAALGLALARDLVARSSETLRATLG